jgi:hypothetical protein
MNTPEGWKKEIFEEIRLELALLNKASLSR